MIIRVHSKPNSKKEYIKKLDRKKYIVSVKERAVKGKANKRILEIIAKHFKIPRSKAQIIKGEKFKNKYILIEKK